MKFLLLEILLIMAFLLLKFSHVFTRAFSNISDYLASKAFIHSFTIKKIDSWIYSHSVEDRPLGSIGYTTDPLFNQKEVEQMAIEALQHFGDIPRIKDIESYYDISDRQARKIRQVLVDEYDRQMRIKEAEETTLQIFRNGVQV